jgi:peroxiredoxin
MKSAFLLAILFLATPVIPKTYLLESNTRIPDFKYITIEGESLNRDSLTGKYWLIEFWASWCLPCRKQHPNFNTMLAKLESEDISFRDRLGIIGISLDKDTSTWRKAISNDHLNWDHQICDTLLWEGQSARIFEFSYMPFNILIDDKGIIQAQGLYGAGLEEKLRELLLR